jgi:hypothetical protein
MSIGSSVLGKPKDWKLESASLKIGLPKPFDVISFTLKFRRKNGRLPTSEEIGKAKKKYLLRKKKPRRRKNSQVIQVANKQFVVR